MTQCPLCERRRLEGGRRSASIGPFLPPLSHPHSRVLRHYKADPGSPLAYNPPSDAAGSAQSLTTRRCVNTCCAALYCTIAMATTLFLIPLCGAVPFDPSSSDDPAPAADHCHNCHRLIETLLIERTFSHFPPPHQPEPSLAVVNLPDVVADSIQQPAEATTKGDQLDRPFSSPSIKHDDLASWKQVGRDLRTIADHFQSSSLIRRNSSAKDTSNWSWMDCVLKTLAVYVGWRIHRSLTNC